MSNDPKVNEIVEKYMSSYDYYKDYRDKLVQYYKKYRAWLDISSVKEYYKWRSKLFIPAIGRAVDGLVVNLWLAMFGRDPFFQVQPREEGDIRRAPAMESLMGYQFHQGGFKMEFFQFLVQLGIYGSSFGKVTYKKETKKVKRRRPRKIFDIVLPGEFQLTEEEETVCDYPIFEPIDIFDFFVSPSATSLKDTWVIQRFELTLGELKKKQKEGLYKNVEDLESIIWAHNSDRIQADERKFAQNYPSAWGKETGDDRKIEIIEYWNTDRTKVCTIAGRSVKLREKDNKTYIDPFIRATLWDLPFEFFGIGVAEKGGDLQDQLNVEVNSRMDNRSLKQNFIIKVRRGAGVNVRQLVSKPGAVWLCDDMDAIKTEVVPDIGSNTSFAEENLLKQEIEEITGVTKYATGAGAETTRKTATEVSQISRSGSKGFAVFVDKISEQAMKPIIEKFYTLNELFMSEDKVMRILGEKGAEFIRMKPDDVIGNYDFIPASSSDLVDKNLVAQNLLQFLGIAGQDPSLNRQGVYRKFWEALGHKDYTEIMNPNVDPNTTSMIPQKDGAAPARPGVAPTGMRPGTPREGGVPVTVGLGGQRPQ